jgi:hypothetical protein
VENGCDTRSGWIEVPWIWSVAATGYELEMMKTVLFPTAEVTPFKGARERSLSVNGTPQGEATKLTTEGKTEIGTLENASTPDSSYIKYIDLGQSSGESLREAEAVKFDPTPFTVLVQPGSHSQVEESGIRTGVWKVWRPAELSKKARIVARPSRTAIDDTSPTVDWLEDPGEKGKGTVAASSRSLVISEAGPTRVRLEWSSNQKLNGFSILPFGWIVVRLPFLVRTRRPVPRPEGIGICTDCNEFWPTRQALVSYARPRFALKPNDKIPAESTWTVVIWGRMVPGSTNSKKKPLNPGPEASVVILRLQNPGLSELVKTRIRVGCMWPRAKVPAGLNDEFRSSTFKGSPYETIHNSSPIV